MKRLLLVLLLLPIVLLGYKCTEGTSSSTTYNIADSLTIGTWIDADSVDADHVTVNVSFVNSGYNDIDSLDADHIVFNANMVANGATIDANYYEASAATDGTRYFDFTVEDSTDPAGSAEVSAGYFAMNKRTGSNGTYTLNGLEGVARSYYPDEAGTFRGVYGRTYINADDSSTMRTAIGGEFSARASYNGGTECIPENGTAFVGARIWMAPYFDGDSLDNINNFWGLWIYGEHTSQRNADAAIKINDAGGGWGNGLDITGTFSDHVIDIQPAASLGDNKAIYIGTWGTEAEMNDGGGLFRIYGKVDTGGTATANIFVRTLTESTTPPISAQFYTDCDADDSVSAPNTMDGIDVFTIINDNKYFAEPANDSLDMLEGMRSIWAKVGASSGSHIYGNVATIWVDNQIKCTVTGNEYGIFSTTGGSKPDAWAGFETTSSGWSYLFEFDKTSYDQDPVASGDCSSGTKGYYLKVNINGTAYGLQLYEL